LMARLCGILVVDAPETLELGDPRRAEEFAKLRKQLISSGAVKAIAEMAAPGNDLATAVEAAGALAAFAGVGSDAAMRASLAEAGAVPHLLKHLPGYSVEATAGAAEPTAVGEEAAAADDQAAGAAGAGEGAAVGGVASTGADTAAAAAVAGSDGDSDSDEEAQCSADAARVAALTALASVAAAEGDGTDGLTAPMREPRAMERLRALMSEDGRTSKALKQTREQAIRCLVALGRQGGSWPEVDESLASDLLRLLTFGSDAAGVLLAALLEDRTRAAQLGDLRPLRRSVVQGGRQAAAVAEVLEATRSCEQCGKASERALLVCTGCRKAEYCSRDCQRAAWKLHKAACAGAKK